MSPILPARSSSGEPYRRAQVLVRLHTQALDVVEIQLCENGLSAEELVKALWLSLNELINEHLIQDGLPPVAQLTTAGLPQFDTPKCVVDRETLLAEAPAVSVIVATRDRPAGLATCLKSLLALEYPCFEVIVVDNASQTRAAAEVVARFNGDVKVRYVREEIPGLAVAHNRGL
ncbi:MAG TPA: glycosyltransferase family A protein, partial [Anaerolineae bacterium]|nr:glycosyltransferase family A protein [Anaerolineae bacterium]